MGSYARAPGNLLLATGRLGLVADRPDATLAEIVAHLDTGYGVKVSQSTLWRFFEATVSAKKVHAAEQDRPDVKAAREARSDR